MCKIKWKTEIIIRLSNFLPNSFHRWDLRSAKSFFLLCDFSDLDRDAGFGQCWKSCFGEWCREPRSPKVKFVLLKQISIWRPDNKGKKSNLTVLTQKLFLTEKNSFCLLCQLATPRGSCHPARWCQWWGPPCVWRFHFQEPSLPDWKTRDNILYILG